MESALFKRLELFTRLSSEDRAALSRLTTKIRVIEPRKDLIREGDLPTHVNLVLRGWGARYKMLPDGKRSLVGFFIPGDFCDLNTYILKQMDHSIGAITSLRVATIEPHDLLQLMVDHPQVTQALLWHELVNAAVQREWTHNIGARPAFQRLAHLLVELFMRMQSIGLADANSCDFPLTQYDLAEATGLTPVHVNRTLQLLRGELLVEIGQKRLRIPDLARLQEAAMFNPNYLHLDRDGADPDAHD